MEVRVGEGDWQTARIVSAPSRGSWYRWELMSPLNHNPASSPYGYPADLAGATQPVRAEWNPLGYGNNSIQRVSIQVV